MSHLRQGRLTSDSSKSAPSSSYIAFDLLYHISSFSKVLAAADVLDTIGSPIEKAAFAELKSLTLTMMNSAQNESINMQPFLEKLSAWTNVDYCQVDQTDVLCVWDDIVKLIMVVIPPLREVFLGQVSSNLEVPGWLNLMSRCFHAHFTETAMSLEEVYLNSLTSSPSPLMSTALTDDGSEQQTATLMVTNNVATAEDKLRIANAMILRRAPEILVVSIESSHLSPQCSVRQTGSALRGPNTIRYPETFDLANFSPTSNHATCNNGNHSASAAKIYDLSTVVALEGEAFDELQTYFRITNEGHEERWYSGAGFICEEVSKGRAVEGNFYGGSSERRAHPRLLVYTRRDLPLVLERTLLLVSKAGQMRALGDVAFAAAMTTENYGDARRCYEEAIALDEGLRVALQENLSSLEKIERTQRARVLEEQADLALANKRFREASELYSKGMMNAVVSSGVYLRVRDKLESVTHIIALDSACQFAEKGEEALLLGLLPNAKDLYSQAYKLNPEFLHLHTILVGIDKTVQMLNAGQRIADAQTAAKAYHYKLANHFYREAIALVPEKLAGLQSTLDSLAPLMQGEDALMRQKSGLAAMEDKRYTAAIQLFTEAIGLLPMTQASCLEHAVFLCDRALAHYDLKDFNTAVADCTLALQLKPELAIAHFRLGAAQFGLDQFDLASSSYDRALKCDSSLSESIKVKVRQVTTAREIQQRKQRETERIKAKEEEKKMLDEKRARDELAKKERAEKLAIEQAEKAERNRIKEEEKRIRVAKEKEQEKEKEKEKEAEKERLRIEKVERDAQKAAERERLRLEKEKERERLRIEKEQKAIDYRKAQDEEKRRQMEFTAELEKGAARQRELEREKEIEKEKARVERERLVAEREKIRKEKLEIEAAKMAAEAAALKVFAIPSSSAIQAPITNSAPLPTEVANITSILKRETPPPMPSSTQSITAAVPGSATATAPRWFLSQPMQSPSLALPSSSPYTPVDQSPGDSKINSAQSPSSARGGNSKVWTASKSSADTITRIPSAPASRLRKLQTSVDDTSDFPTLGEPLHQTRRAANGLDDGQELGWSIRRASPAKTQEPSNAIPSSLSSSNDIFSSMADRSTMSTDYTFKPSEKTIKAAEAKRLADSQLKAAAAASAANHLSDSLKGDFDEFLSSSSASYISNFSSGIRFNPAFTADPSPSNGLFFTSTPSSIGAGDQISSPSSSPLISNGYVEPPNLEDFSSSFSGLGFASSFLSASSSSSPSNLNGVRGSGGNIHTPNEGFRGIIPLLPASQSIGLDENDDDFSSGYFTNPLSSLGGLDLDDTTDPLLLAIGGLGLPLTQSDILPSIPNIAIPLMIPDDIDRIAPLSHHSSPHHMGHGGGYPNSSSFSMPVSPSRSGTRAIYATASSSLASSSSSVYPIKVEYASVPSPQRSFQFGSEQGPKQGPLPSFSNMGAIGSQNTNISNLKGAEKFSTGIGLNGSNGDFSADYFNGAQRLHGVPHQQPPYGVQSQLHMQPVMMFSPFRPHTQLNSTSSIGSSISTEQNRDRMLSSHLYPDPPSAPNHLHIPSNFQIAAAPSSSSVPIGQEGIEADILPESAFVSVAWLRQHGMHMYRWAGDASEWTEYAMHLPPNVSRFVCPGPSSFPSLLPELQSSGCKIWVDKETLLGREAIFLVFLRGAAGQPSNSCMNLALEMLSNKMRTILPQVIPQVQSFGSIGSNRGSPPPPQFIGMANTGMRFVQSLPHSAWGAGTSPTAPFATVGADAGAGVTQMIDEEEHSTLSDEYYDPEDLARSLSLSGEGVETTSDWNIATTRRSTFTPSSQRPEPLRVLTLPGGYVQRWLEIPRDSVGLVIGQGGKKIKELCTLSGAKIQFRVNKTAEREGRPGLLELQGGADNVDQGLQLVWDLLHLLGKEYVEIPVQRLK